MGRRLGQHFLFDPRILDRIVDALNPEHADRVLEIGPGRGSLTTRLAPRVGTLVAIERDPDLARRLAATPPSGCTVLAADALDLDWSTVWPDADRPHKVVGNVPYAITTPLIEKALGPPAPSVIVFLVQREVGNRLAARAGTKTYGALSVGVQAVAEVERLFAVKAGSFRPPPRVESVVVRLRPRTVPLVSPAEHPAFRTLVTALFGQRRRQLARALRTVWGRAPDEVRTVLNRLDLDPEARPEVLDPQAFVRLMRADPR